MIPPEGNTVGTMTGCTTSHAGTFLQQVVCCEEGGRGRERGEALGFPHPHPQKLEIMMS